MRSSPAAYRTQMGTCTLGSFTVLPCWNTILFGRKWFILDKIVDIWARES